MGNLDCPTYTTQLLDAGTNYQAVRIPEAQPGFYLISLVGQSAGNDYYDLRAASNPLDTGSSSASAETDDGLFSDGVFGSTGGSVVIFLIIGVAVVAIIVGVGFVVAKRRTGGAGSINGTAMGKGDDGAYAFSSSVDFVDADALMGPGSGQTGSSMPAYQPNSFRSQPSSGGAMGSTVGTVSSFGSTLDVSQRTTVITTIRSRVSAVETPNQTGPIFFFFFFFGVWGACA